MAEKSQTDNPDSLAERDLSAAHSLERNGAQCNRCGVGKLYTYQFPTRDSIILLAVVLMGGIYSLWGAVVAGALRV